MTTPEEGARAWARFLAERTGGHDRAGIMRYRAVYRTPGGDDPDPGDIRWSHAEAAGGALVFMQAAGTAVKVYIRRGRWRRWRLALDAPGDVRRFDQTVGGGGEGRG